MSAPPLQLIEGDGSADIVQALEAALERARKGEIEALALVCLEDGIFEARYAWKDELNASWALFVAGLEHAKYDLLESGL